jgi:prepilin-type N-terminal cleavage/methylation domain-containing protein
MSFNNKGMSLLEVIIALGLFATVMAAVIETAISMKNVTDQYGTLVDMEQEGREIMEQITRDLSRSGSDTIDGNSFPRTSAVGDYGSSIRFLRLYAPSPSNGSPGVHAYNFDEEVTPMTEWAQPKQVAHGLLVNPGYTINNTQPLISTVWEPVKNANLADPYPPVTYQSNDTYGTMRIYKYEPVVNNNGQATLRLSYSENGGTTFPEANIVRDIGRHVYFIHFSKPGNNSRIDVKLILRNYDAVREQRDGIKTTEKAHAERTFQTSIRIR